MTLPNVTNFIATAPATEGGVLSFRVELDQTVIQKTTLFYTILPSSTAEGSDFIAGSLTIDAFQSIGFLNMQTNEDDDFENETLVLQLNTSSVVNTFNRMATGTIVDDDTPSQPPTVSISGSPSVDEGGTLVFTVTRSGGSASQPLTIFYSTGGQAQSGSDYTAPGSVTIPAGSLGDVPIDVEIGGQALPALSR